MNRIAVLSLCLVALASCGDRSIGDIGGSLANRSAAERACVQEAQDQGLDMRVVAESRPVSGDGGIVVGRDVVLTVQSGGEVYDVRCNYTNATGEARIMTL